MWRDNAYLLDMLLAARKVQKFTQDVNWKRFQSDEVLPQAIAAIYLSIFHKTPPA